MKTRIASFVVLAVITSQSHGATALFLSEEFQAQAGTNAGSIRSGDPAGSQAFGDFLGTASLTATSVVSTLTIPGQYAVWPTISDPGPVSSTTINFGGTNVGVSISGWSNATNSLVGASGNAFLDGFGIGGTTMQAGAPRPGFASGSGSGAYIGTNNGATGDGIRNAVTFNLSGFAGGGVYAFGIFGGDLETGAPGSPEGILYVKFTNGDTETIFYTPDSTLFPDAVWTTGNNTSETYGNETGRFVGIADDSRIIESVTFVVGDDDENDNGDSEQLSFIAPIVFLDYDGTTAVPLVPNQVPEPSSALLALGGLVLALHRRR